MEQRGGRGRGTRRVILFGTALAAVALVLAVVVLTDGNLAAAGGAGSICLLCVTAVSFGRQSRHRRDAAVLGVSHARPISFGTKTGLQGMSQVQFQRVVGRLFEKEGFIVSVAADPGPHQIDLLVTRDGKRGVVLCRQTSAQEPLQRQVVRELYESMLYEEAQRGYLVTNGVYSEPATEWAGRSRSLELIDGVELAVRLRQAQTQTQDISS